MGEVLRNATPKSLNPSINTNRVRKSEQRSWYLPLATPRVPTEPVHVAHQRRWHWRAAFPRGKCRMFGTNADCSADFRGCGLTRGEVSCVRDLGVKRREPRHYAVAIVTISSVCRLRDVLRR